MLPTEQNSNQVLYGLCAAAGAAFHHLYARRAEIDFMVWQHLGVASILTGIFVWLAQVLWHIPLATAILKVSAGTAAFLSGLAASILIYRGYFHRVKQFPGPYAARFTTFWAVWISGVDAKFHRRLYNLHREHGDVVRLGPRLLSVNRPDALPQLTALNKATFWGHTGNDHTKISFSLSRLPEDHKQRRRPWEVAFSTPALDKFDRGIQEVIGLFIKKTQDRQGEPIEITTAISRLSFDIMGLVGYGHTFECTARDVSHPGMVAMKTAHAMFGQLRWAPWLMTMLGALPGGSEFTPFMKLCADVVRERQAQHKANKLKSEQEKEETEEFKDVMAYLLEAMDNGGKEATPTEEALGGESRVMIAAGAETTQAAVASTLFFLTATPSVLRKLQILLDNLFPEGPESFSYAKLIANKEAVGWTDAIINETLRLRSANLTGLPRVTGPEGLLIPESEFGPEIWIPGDIEVTMPTWAIQRDPRAFEHPHEFLPARWSEDSGLLCNQAAYFPFYIGKHVCVGKPLAVRELRSIVARVALSFDLEFPAGENWQEYEESIQDLFVLTLPPFNVIFKERRR